MRDAKKGEAVQVDLSHPETYAIVDLKRNEATVAHPNLLSYTPPDERDIHITSNVIVEHVAYQYPKGYGYKGYAPAYGQQQYTVN
ncbi:hypothetical protein DdX_19456 [Ditylenchus destructor]|uniref:Uncharacterized protein n=1 Tax=Ditylenchus destructor TaxID=166010 RepID=A0AAD4MML0_9BILA|nr:hypothetical protein DdX_19456 [Ditylenchus destructor]